MTTKAPITEEDLIATPQRYRHEEAPTNSRVPLLIGGGFLVLFGGNLYRHYKAGSNMKFAFGQVRVQSQIAAVGAIGLLGLWAAMGEQRR